MGRLTKRSHKILETFSRKRTTIELITLSFARRLESNGIWYAVISIVYYASRDQQANPNLSSTAGRDESNAINNKLVRNFSTNFEEFSDSKLVRNHSV